MTGSAHRDGDPAVSFLPASGLAGALYELRRAAHMSQTQIAQELKVSQGSVQKMELGIRPVTEEEVQGYLRVTNPTDRMRARVLNLLEYEKKRPTTQAAASSSLASSIPTTLDSEPTPEEVVDDLLEQVRRSVRVDDQDHQAPVRRYTVTKPAWRRTVTAPQSDPDQWPAPSGVRTPEEFSKAMERIK
ncbi:transcriptional regulator with XRE-family HTH domain, partial [Kutzneria viridogrisea]|nr:transcriptional regulator with XRE-family HTH domain [Kutzneria viridogrisea]